MLAGGESRRFGGPKVLAPLSGAPMASWGLDVLESAGLTVGLISDEEGVEAALGLPARPDLEAGLGPMAGCGRRFSGPVKGVTMECCFSDVTCRS